MLIDWLTDRQTRITKYIQVGRDTARYMDDGWADGWADGWTDGETKEMMDVPIDRTTCMQTVYIDGLVVGWVDGWMNE